MCQEPIGAVSRRLASVVVTSIRRADHTDIDRVCHTLMRAFQDDPLVRWMVADDDAYVNGAGSAFFRLVSRRLFDTGEVWTTPDGVAAAVWASPDPAPGADISAELGALYATFDAATQARMAAVGAAVQEHKPTEPYWYLQFLGTHPDWQRRGLGTALMAPVLELADAEGVGQYLETATDEDVAYYRARGFDVTEAFSVADPLDENRPPVTVTGMWRPARR